MDRTPQLLGCNAAMRRQVTFNHHLITSRQESAYSKDFFFSAIYLNGLRCTSIIQLRAPGVNKRCTHWQITNVYMPHFLYFSEGISFRIFPSFFFLNRELLFDSQHIFEKKQKLLSLKLNCSFLDIQ